MRNDAASLFYFFALCIWPPPRHASTAGLRMGVEALVASSLTSVEAASQGHSRN